MADNSQRSDGIRHWVQTLVIIAGIIAGVWQFVFKEIWTPAAAPINLTTEVSVKEAGFRTASDSKSTEQLEAIELMVTAINVSTRTVYLLSNFWAAWGMKVGSSQVEKAQDWLDAVGKQTSKGEDSYGAVGRHYEMRDGSLVAWGNVFPKTYVLFPKETVSRSFLFYVPKGEYDLVEVDVGIPTTSVPNVAEVVYTVSDQAGVDPRVNRIGPNGVRSEMPKREDGTYLDSGIGLQETESWRQLSLWQSDAPIATSSITRAHKSPE
jgi:hypothetical protein